MKNIISTTLSAALLFGVMVSCQDEVMVKVEDTVAADSLLSQLADYTNQYLTLDEENGTLHIENEKFWRALDSLDEVRDDMSNPYSTPEEVHFTLNVLSSANTVFSGSRTKGVVGAAVTLEQNGLVVAPDASSANGLYLFKGLRNGSAFVKVTAANHTPVEFYVWLDLYHGEDVEGATSYNASTQVIIFPNAGDAAGKITGTAYANTSTLNDTIGYRFGSDINIFKTKANTYITSPGNWRYGNYTQDYGSVEIRSIYDYYYPNGENIQWETATAGHIIYGIPEFNNYDINNASDNGWIYSITYRNVITKATIAADGSFTLPVLAGDTYNDYELFNGVTLTTEEMIAGHTRLTVAEGNFVGQKAETGSTDQTFSYYNRTDAAQPTVYTGTGVTAVNVDPGKKTTITRKKITENWAYYMWVPNDQFGDDDDQYIYATDQAYPQAGETKNRSVYFFPIERR